MLDAAEQNYDSLDEARGHPSSLDAATLDRVERVWGDTQADHWLFVEQVARWKRQPLTSTQRPGRCLPRRPVGGDLPLRLSQAHGAATVNALGELLSSILAPAGQLRLGTIDRIMEKSDIELGLEYFLGGGAQDMA